MSFKAVRIKIEFIKMMHKNLYKLMLNTASVSLTLIFLFLLISCTKIEREPKVETGIVSDITTTSAKVEGNIIDLGNVAITDHGHCWSVSSIPTILDSKTSFGTITSTGSFSSELQNLQPGTKYNLRAYAKSGNDVIYGNVLWFITTQETSAIADIDGNSYITVKVGAQWWMTENLKTTKYDDGTPIPNITDEIEWQELTTGAYCWFGNDESSYKATYGALYNWYTVNTGKLCPTGWHVPSYDEWTTLSDYLGGWAVAGGKLKEIGTTHWGELNEGATNEIGFTALPGGYRDDTGVFYYIGNAGYFWLPNEDKPTTAFYIGIGNNSSYLSRGFTSNKKFGFSVRCIKY
jgi:uncharacterized protein (TIGR02145 family)